MENRKEVEMERGMHSISKKHAFKDLSTRKHYTGEHKLEIVVNGVVKAEHSVILG